MGLERVAACSIANIASSAYGPAELNAFTSPRPAVSSKGSIFSWWIAKISST